MSTVWCEISEYIHTTQHFERNTRVSYYSDHFFLNMLSLTTHCYKLGSIVVSKTLFSKLTLSQIVLFMVNRKYMSRQITESKISSSTPRYPTRYHFWISNIFQKIGSLISVMSVWPKRLESSQDIETAIERDYTENKFEGCWWLHEMCRVLSSELLSFHA